MADAKSLAAQMKALAAKDKKTDAAANASAAKGEGLRPGYVRVRLERPYVDSFGNYHERGIRDLPNGDYPSKAVVLAKEAETSAGKPEDDE